MKAYEISRLAIIFFDFRASYASYGDENTGDSIEHDTDQKETKDDTPYEQPLSDIKRDIETTILTLTVIEDLI